MSESLLSRAHVYVYAVALLVATASLLSLGAPVPASAGGCPNEALRTGPSAHLSDCRAYEMVTPPYKNGGQLKYGIYGLMSPDGSTVLMSSPADGGFGDAGANPLLSNYAMTRTGSGWSTVSTEPPASEYYPYNHFGPSFPDFSGASLDARTTLYSDRGPGKPENSLDLYKREASGAIADIGPELPPTAPLGVELHDLGFQYGVVSEVGLSADGSRAFFYREHQLYEYDGVGNTTPMPVGVNNAGELISQCATSFGGPGFTSSTHNAVSFDSKTVFFTAESKSEADEVTYACAPTTAPPAFAEVYARVNNGQPGAHTVAISEPSVEDCAACDTAALVRAPATFLGASEDGSKVFFTTTQPLLGGDASENVYEYDFDAPVGQRIVHVSGGDGSVSGPTAEVVGTPQTSEDGSHAYFFARGVLTANPNRYGQSAQPGANNLYVFERDAQYPSGRTVFIATLSADNAEHLWGYLQDEEIIEIEPHAYLPGVTGGANVSPNGDFFLFTSKTDLTPDDTSGVKQVFEYDARSGTLVRVSVGQNGFNDNGNTDLWGAEIVQPTYRTGIYSAGLYASHRSLSANGEYVFFQSVNALTPEALNHKLINARSSQRERTGPFITQYTYAENVYEYHNGVVSLISDGRDLTGAVDSSSVELLGTNESGGDVFFTTGDSLVGQDTDDNVDVYDARVDGGFPPPISSSGCLGESCQGQLSGAPTLLSPGSEFQAGANPPLAGSVPKVAASKPKAKLAKCRKGFTRRHGRCVKNVKSKRSHTSTRSKRGRKS